jgi:TonB family protein
LLPVLVLIAAALVAEKPAPRVTAPRFIEKPEPEYTQQARAAGVEGTVQVKGELDEVGRLRALRVIKSLGYGLDENAIRCAEQWRFEPATRDGVAIRVSVIADVNFRLLPRQ